LLLKVRPSVCYVFDMAFSGVLAATLYRATSGMRIVVDTGDAISELARLTGRSRTGVWMTQCLEWLALRISHRLVVRSHFHQQWMAARGFVADVIPDGVDTTQFFPLPNDDLRRSFGFEGITTIGVLGNVIWNPVTDTCYGWELVELVRILKEEKVRGIIVGDGSGITRLRARCAAYGIEDRVLFLGRLPYASLPPILNLMDICLSTQTNDLAGKVRTTGKLPLYLACGRLVLSTDVGEASLVLPAEMLIPCTGIGGDEYPEKLASRVLELIRQPDTIHRTAERVAIATRYFDYPVLAEKLGLTIRTVLASGNQLKAEPGKHFFRRRQPEKAIDGQSPR
jgi:glycosyltransferase involved in cell wall biosynthesis